MREKKHFHSTHPAMKLVVVGGGIMGLCSGMALLEAYPTAQVTIISEKWSPHTTGDVSAGLIYLYAVGAETNKEMLHQIFGDSVEFFKSLMHSDPESGNKAGISLLTMFEFQKGKHAQLDEGALRHLPSHKGFDESFIKLLYPHLAEQYHSGTESTCFVVEPALFLPYLMNKFQSKGGILQTGRINALRPLLDEYDLVVNCSGVGARFMADLPDLSLQPARGQVIRVEAPWIRHAIMTEEFYILPNQHCIVLGGCKQIGNFDLTPSKEMEQHIWENCCRLEPSLRGARKLRDCVGLRPYRSAVRVENDSKHRRIIHNYGHGGSGVTLCWGSAVRVTRLAREALFERAKL